MAAKAKRSAKHTKKQGSKKSPKQTKQPVEKKAVKTEVSKPVAAPAAAKQEATQLSRNVLIVILLLFVGVILIAVVVGGKSEDIPNQSSTQSDGPSTLHVVGTDGNVSGLDPDLRPSTEAGNALQAQSSASQAPAQQSLQPNPAQNLQADSTPSMNALNVN